MCRIGPRKNSEPRPRSGAQPAIRVRGDGRLPTQYVTTRGAPAEFYTAFREW